MSTKVQNIKNILSNLELDRAQVKELIRVFNT